MVVVVVVLTILTDILSTYLPSSFLPSSASFLHNFRQHFNGRSSPSPALLSLFSPVLPAPLSSSFSLFPLAVYPRQVPNTADDDDTFALFYILQFWNFENDLQQQHQLTYLYFCFFAVLTTRSQ